MSSFNEPAIYQTFYSEFPSKSKPTFVDIHNWADDIEMFAAPIHDALVAHGVDDTEQHRSNILVLAFLDITGTSAARVHRAAKFYVESGLKDMNLGPTVVADD